MIHRSGNAVSALLAVTKRGAISAVLACAVHAYGTAAFAGAQETKATPIGVWKTVDDKTHRPKALVQITQDDDGTLSGKVIEGLDASESPDRRCTQCTDSRKDQKILGMTIIRRMKKNGEEWDGGDILDPENGKVYRCKMRLEAGGKTLVVRGYIGISLIGRSQTWVREEP
jgi:uncharacterized protein (DUF2147 family)